jgi:DNA-binding MarR family transcriptional regulator
MVKDDPKYEMNERAYREASRSYKDHLPWTDAAATELSLRIVGCAASLNDAMGMTLNRAGFLGSTVRYSVLRSLYFAQGHRLTHNETSRSVSVSPGTLTRVVDGMESAGLVARVVDPKDRRTTFLHLTPSGEKIAAELVVAVTAMRNEIFEIFSDSEKDSFLAFLRRVQSRAESATVKKK